jgi:hypothetical protein
MDAKIIFSYVLLIIVYDSIVFTKGNSSIRLSLTMIKHVKHCLDIDIAHAGSYVRREIWNWWDYTDGVSGPAAWGFYFPLCDSGRYQSPINIESRHLIFDHQLTPIYINHSDHVRDMKFIDVIFSFCVLLNEKITFV